MSAAVATPLEKPQDTATEFQALQFLVLQRLLKMQTATVVEVQAVHGGGLSSTGTVDVLPLVGQVDGAGNLVPHKTIYGRPYCRWQGGSSAVVLDPSKGDIGLCVFCSRDISSVIASKAPSAPPSRRRFAYPDGLYISGWSLNMTPVQWVRFLVNEAGEANGIDIVSSIGPVTVNGVSIDTAADVSTSGNITSSGQVEGATLKADNGATGGFTSSDGKAVTVQNGIITAIV